MNITKDQADKVIAALEVGRIWAECEKQDRSAKFCNEALSIMRGLAEDAEPPKIEKFPRVTQSIAETILGRGLDALSQGEQERMISAAQRRLDSVMTQLYTARLATSPQAPKDAEPVAWRDQDPAHMSHMTETLNTALGALEYHQEQTRPIERTQQAIRKIRSELTREVMLAPCRKHLQETSATSPQAAQTDERNGCQSNCRTCQHFRRDTGGHCYMFKEEPQGVCAKWIASNTLAFGFPSNWAGRKG